MTRPPSADTIVVLETGSHWPAWIDDRSSGPRSDVYVIAQDPEEGPDAFRQRALEYIEGLHGAARAVSRAVIACSERVDDSALVRRSALARALMELVGDSEGAGEVILAKDPRSRSREEIVALARQLSEQSRNPRVSVSARFGDPASRAFSSAPPPAPR